MRYLTIGIIQQHNSADVADNKDRLGNKIRSLAKQGAELIVLQELHNSLYFCQEENTACFDLAHPIPGPDSEWLAGLARVCGVVIVGSLFERRAAGLYHNSAVVFDKDGSLCGKYRKMHIPDDPSYYEKFYFTPGDLGFQPIQTSVGRLGVMQRGHAVANGLPVIAVNRVGKERDAVFWGSSFVAGPQGELLYRGPQDEEAEALVKVCMDRSEEVRRWWPFLRDRRIEEYGCLTKRFDDD